MNYSFLPEAEAEYIEAVRFYEEQQAKLGKSLIHEFERIIALIIERPEAWRLFIRQGCAVLGYCVFLIRCFIV